MARMRIPAPTAFPAALAGGVMGLPFVAGELRPIEMSQRAQKAGRTAASQNQSRTPPSGR